jgi:biopolymer transport protein ExbB/TolQ
MAVLIVIIIQIGLSDVTAVISIITSIIIALAVITGVVWWVWKGQDVKQLKEDLARAEKRNSELKDEALEAKNKKVEALQEKADALVELNRIKAELKSTEGKLQRSLEREEDTAKENLRLLGERDHERREK